MSKYKLNPGSDEAIEKGCRCPVMDNGHGRGCGMFDEKTGDPLFWINEGCPLHDWTNKPPDDNTEVSA